jgi:hypothetical protein
MTALRRFANNLYIVGILMVLTCSTSRALPPPLHLSTGATLNVPLYGQQTNVWCWDASSLMVIKYFRPLSPLKQCDLANQATNVNNCCNNPFPTICVHTGWQMLSNNGFVFSDSSSALSWDDLRKQIDSGRPVLYAWGWNGGGGHMMVATGYYNLLNQNFVEINNPWPPASSGGSGGAKESYTYAAWVGGPGYDHVFWHDWYNVADKTKIVVRPRPFPIFATIPIIPIGPGPVEQSARVPDLIINQAMRTLQAITKATSDIQLQTLGTRSAQGARLGTPVREYSVGLSSLQAFKAGMDPSRIVGGGNEFFFPVFIGVQAQSGIRIVRVGSEAKTESVGGAAIARQLAAMTGTKLSASSTVAIDAVRIPALGLYFLARGNGASLQLASLYDVPAYDLRHGAYRSAASIFASLGAIARRQKGAM